MAKRPKRGVTLTADDVRFIGAADGAVLAVVSALVTYLAEDGLVIEGEFIDGLHMQAMGMEARGIDPALVSMFRFNITTMTPKDGDEPDDLEPANENEPG